MKLKIEKKELGLFIKNTLLVVLGTVIIAFSVSLFAIPFNLVTGGVSGMAIVLKHLTRDVAFLSAMTAEMYAVIINSVFFFIGLFVLGKAFALKTLASAAVYPIAMWAMSMLKTVDFFNLSSPLYAEYQNIALLLAAVIGGAVLGLGVALTFMGGGSSGGIDVIALAVSKYVKRTKSSHNLFAMDTIIITCGIFVFQDLVLTIIGLISAFSCVTVVDKVFTGSSRAFTAQIVSDKPELINEGVIKRMRRTTTITEAYGGFSGEKKKVISVTFSMDQYAMFTALIAAVDKDAFVTVSRAHEINGEGWTWGLHEKGTKVSDIAAADENVSEGAPTTDDRSDT